MDSRLRILLLLFFLVLLSITSLTAFAAQRVDDDFSLELSINDQDISTLDAIAVDPDDDLIIDLHIFETSQEVLLHNLSLSITFSGLPVATITESL